MTIQVYRDDIDNIYLQKYTQEFVGENKKRLSIPFEWFWFGGFL